MIPQLRLDHLLRQRLTGGKLSDHVPHLLAVERHQIDPSRQKRAVAELVGIEGGVVSGVINLESSGVEASDWRPRHDEQYHDA